MLPIALVKTNGVFTHLRFAFVEYIDTDNKYDNTWLDLRGIDGTSLLLYPKASIFAERHSNDYVDYIDVDLGMLSYTEGIIAPCYLNAHLLGYSDLGVVSDGIVEKDIPAVHITRSVVHVIPTKAESAIGYADMHTILSEQHIHISKYISTLNTLYEYALFEQDDGSLAYLYVYPDGRYEFKPFLLDGLSPAANTEGAWLESEDVPTLSMYIRLDSSHKIWRVPFKALHIPDGRTPEERNAYCDTILAPYQLSDFVQLGYSLVPSVGILQPDMPYFYPAIAPTFTMGNSTNTDFAAIYLPSKLITGSFSVELLKYGNVQLPAQMGTAAVQTNGALSSYKTLDIHCLISFMYSSTYEESHDFKAHVNAPMVYLVYECASSLDAYNREWVLDDVSRVEFTSSFDDSMFLDHTSLLVSPKCNYLDSVTIQTSHLEVMGMQQYDNRKATGLFDKTMDCCTLVLPEGTNIGRAHLTVFTLLEILTPIRAREVIIDWMTAIRPTLDLSNVECERLFATIDAVCWGDSGFHLGTCDVLCSKIKTLVLRLSLNMYYVKRIRDNVWLDLSKCYNLDKLILLATDVSGAHLCHYIITLPDVAELHLDLFLLQYTCIILPSTIKKIVIHSSDSYCTGDKLYKQVPVVAESDEVYSLFKEALYLAMDDIPNVDMTFSSTRIPCTQDLDELVTWLDTHRDNEARYI